MITHRMAQAPRRVYDEEGERVGYIATCACMAGVFSPVKDECWKLIAEHMVIAVPELTALAAEYRARSVSET